ncbi:putative baseplate assembly protein [Nocardia xishanensis]|uniref:putative baseplate assembly protein n=1 Tax=Nocardia xishanensis TaxID=238964 RepID=UPI0033F7C06D
MISTALPLQNLDDRRWIDLVEEARALIPFHAPGWTDHNAHDPGITLVELFAFIAEMDLYRVNRITDAHRRKFLALAGITPAPPQPATTILGLRLAPGEAPLPLPAGLEFTGHDPFGTPIRFRARHDLTVQPGRLAAVLAEDTHSAAPRDLTTAWLRGEPILPFGPDPQPGAALYLGFDPPAAWTPGTLISLGVAIGDSGGRSGSAERDRIAAEAAAATADCVPPWKILHCDGQEEETTNHGRSVHNSAVLSWELRNGAGHWTRLAPEEVADDTRAMTLDGRVILRIPGPVAAGTLGARPGDLVWLRARLIHGGFDAPPVLQGLTDNAVEAEQAVPATTRLRLAQGAQVSGEEPVPGEFVELDVDLDRRGEVRRIRFGPPRADIPVVRLLALDMVKRSLVVEAAAVVRGTGGPGQRIDVPHAPLVAASLQVTGLEDGTWRIWSARPDFDASTRADAHFTAEPTAGTILLGDGEQGRTAPAGTTLLVTADLTRAAGGNLAMRTIDRLADSPHNRAVADDLEALAGRLVRIANITPAAGGAAAESVSAAIARARDEREDAARAITLDDYATLARQTPGVRLARAEARANAHPGFPCRTAPGVVTVLVLPHLPADRPVPSPGLRRAVAAYLNRRRVIGTRVEVAEPEYVHVTVRATVHAATGTPTAGLTDAVRAALDGFLHPLTGGPDGIGWPFGRDVHRSEVLAVIGAVPGIAHVLALELVSDGQVSCADVCIGPLGLVDAGPHEIEVR